MTATSYIRKEVLCTSPTLSRAYLTSPNRMTGKKDEEEFEKVWSVDDLDVQKDQLSKIKAATAEDEDIKIVMRLIQKGWPKQRDEAPMSAHPYFTVRNELSIQDGLLFKVDRVVVPASLHSDMLRWLHASHIGMEGCIQTCYAGFMPPILEWKDAFRHVTLASCLPYWNGRMHSDMLRLLHASHIGMEGCIQTCYTGFMPPILEWKDAFRHVTLASCLPYWNGRMLSDMLRLLHASHIGMEGCIQTCYACFMPPILEWKDAFRHVTLASCLPYWNGRMLSDMLRLLHASPIGMEGCFQTCYACFMPPILEWKDAFRHVTLASCLPYWNGRMHSDMLRLLHASHIGMEGCIQTCYACFMPPILEWKDAFRHVTLASCLPYLNGRMLSDMLRLLHASHIGMEGCFQTCYACFMPPILEWKDAFRHVTLASCLPYWNGRMLSDMLCLLHASHIGMEGCIQTCYACFMPPILEWKDAFRHVTLASCLPYWNGRMHSQS